MLMAYTPAFPASPTFASFNRVKTPRIRLFPCSSAKFASNSLLVGSFGRNKLGVVSFNAVPNKEGNLEISKELDIPSKFAWPDKKRPRVCILGGGFGGLYTALRLESLVWPNEKKPQVLLIDQSERFVFKPMLYELLSGEVDSWEIAPRFSELLANTGVQFFQDKVKRLHPSDHLRSGPTGSSYGGTVHLESGLTIEYDWLVLALGADSKRDVVPGAAEFAIAFSTLEDACKVNDKLKILERKNFGTNTPACVAVVGCGYSGVELAATISERLQDRGVVQAINVGNEILPDAPSGNRQAAQKVLSSRKVQLLQGYFVSCIRQNNDMGSLGKLTEMDVGNFPEACNSDPDKLILELQPTEKGQQSQLLEADLVLWTVGSKSLLPQLEPCEPYELPLNGRGQVETDETLQVKGHPRIFAVGDSSATRDSKGKLLPATAQVAFQQADFAGWNLWAAINERPLLPFRFQNLGEMMVLGRNDAALSPTFVEGLTFEGPIGHAARKLAYLYRLPTDEHRIKVGISWLAKSAVDSVTLLQDTLVKVLQGS